MKKLWILATALLSLNVSSVMASPPSTATVGEMKQFINDKVKEIKATAPDDAVTVQTCYLSKHDVQEERAWSCHDLAFSLTPDDLLNADKFIFYSQAKTHFPIVKSIKTTAEGDVDKEHVDFTAGITINIKTDSNFKPFIGYEGNFFGDIVESPAAINGDGVGLPRTRHVNFDRPVPQPQSATHMTLKDESGIYFYSIIYTGEKVSLVN